MMLLVQSNGFILESQSRASFEVVISAVSVHVDHFEHKNV